MSQKLFITDFDGVVCDSVIECLLVSYNAYHRLHVAPFRRLFDVKAIIPAKRELFRNLRPYLKGAEDFVPMFIAMEQGESITCQKDFTDFREQHAEKLPEFVEAFYAERDFLKTRERNLWLSLNPLFDNFVESFRQQKSFEHVYILTTKRQDDVMAVFEYQNIQFPADHVIYQKADGKSARLLELMREHDADAETSAYIEDQVDFLVESQKQKIGSYLVDWGYVSAEQKALAQKHDIPIIHPQTFTYMLRDFG